MLDNQDIQTIKELVDDSNEKQAILISKRIEESENNLREEFSLTFDIKFAPFDARLTEIQKQLTFISRNLDKLESQIQEHMQQNNQDINQMMKDIEGNKRRLTILEKAAQQLQSV